jgi:hypothetical protein
MRHPVVDMHRIVKGGVVAICLSKPRGLLLKLSSTPPKVGRRPHQGEA